MEFLVLSQKFFRTHNKFIMHLVVIGCHTKDTRTSLLCSNGVFSS